MIVFFDLNGTLVDPRALAEPLGPEPGDPELVLGALDHAVAQAMVLTVGGEYRPLPELLGAALRQRLALAGRDPGLADAALARLPEMPAFPEARAALERLRAAGIRTAVLTQSSTDSAETVLTNAGLRDALELVIGTDTVEVFKPDRRVYAEGLRRAEAAAADAWLVAAHWWDVWGAQRAGLHTGWVGRRERLLLDSVPEPDVRGADLLEVAEAIAERA